MWRLKIKGFNYKKVHTDAKSSLTANVKRTSTNLKQLKSQQPKKLHHIMLGERVSPPFDHQTSLVMDLT